jgi:hypothetical protein
MTRTALLALFLLPGLAAAQELRSGPNAPAVSSQIPPTSLPRDPASAAPSQPTTGAPGTQGTDHIRGVQPGPDHRIGEAPVPGAQRRPPADHQVLGGPPVPGATQPEASEGFTTNRDRIPPGIGGLIRPAAPTTDTGQQRGGRGADGGGR